MRYSNRCDRGVGGGGSWQLALRALLSLSLMLGVWSRARGEAHSVPV